MKIRLGYVAISNALGKKVTSSSNVTYKTYSKITSEEKKIEKLNIDEIIFCGDYITDFPEPHDVLKLIKECEKKL